MDEAISKDIGLILDNPGLWYCKVKDGAITKVVDTLLFIQDHSECTLFAVTNLGDQQMLLGHNWLVNHNPEIDWAKDKVKFTRCNPHCSECLKQQQAKHNTLHKWQRQSENLEQVQRIFLPSLNHHILDITNKDEEDDDSDCCKGASAREEDIKEGD